MSMIKFREVTYADVNSDFNNYLNNLLKKQPSQRICSFRFLKSHSFFKDFSWKDLTELRFNPPFIPKELRDAKSSLNVKQMKFVEMINVSTLYNCIQSEKFGKITKQYGRNNVELSIGEDNNDESFKWNEEFQLLRYEGVNKP